MATGDIIQKDLGLVTAYGYALAGGYTGSEEQFKTDFAALMSGQYSALGNKPSINGVTLVGNKTSDDLNLKGVTDYADLENKPSINSYILVGDKTAEQLGLQEKLTAGDNISIAGNVISASGGGSQTVIKEDVTSKFGSRTGVSEASAPQISSITRYTCGAVRQCHLEFTMPAGTYSSAYIGDIYPNATGEDVEDYLPYYFSNEGYDRQGFRIRVYMNMLRVANLSGSAITLSNSISMTYTTELFMNLGLFS